MRNGEKDEKKEVKTEIRFREDNGIYKWLFCRILLIRHDNHLVFASGSIEDISERTEMFRMLVEQSRDGIVIYTNEGSIIEWNKAEEEITGIKKQDAIGSDIFRVDKFLFSNKISNIPGKSQDRKTNLLDGADNLSDIVTVQISITRADGSERQLQRTTFPITGKEAIKAAIFHDISELRQAEDQLMAAKIMAEESNNAQSLFLANMSHEIRTPISGIIGFTDMLLETELAEEQEEYLRILKESTLSLLHLVNDILDYSKIEAREIRFIKKDFLLTEVIQKAINLFRYQTETRKLSILSDISEKIPVLLYGDPERLGQVLKNILSNAVKFTEKGRIELSVSCVQKEETITLLFSIKDTGIGIPKGRIKDVFKNFTQIENIYSRQTKGTGLGLSISKTLVEMMGGKIRVKSRIQEGSTFSFTAEFQAGRGKTGNIAEILPEPADTSAASNYRILLAEDTEMNQMFIKHFLEKEGHSVTVVDTGKKALAAVKEDGNFDLVLMDIQMPEMSGMDATRKIRKVKATGKIPIIALTAFVIESDKQKFIEAGMDAFVSKPIDMEHLFSVIKKIMKRKQQSNIAIKNELSIDFKKLSIIYKDDITFLEELFKIFLKNMPGRIIDLKTALNNKDIKQAEIIAHSIGNITGTISASNAYEIAKKIESWVKDNKIEKAETCFRSLNEEIILITAILKKRIGMQEPSTQSAVQDPPHLF